MTPIVRVTFVIDPHGSAMRTSEEELEEHVKRFSELLAPATMHATSSMSVDDRCDADMIVFDFGGMCFGNDLMGSNSRRLIRWAQDHPSALIVIASTFTYAHGLEQELFALGLLPEDAPSTSMMAEAKTIEPPLSNVMVYNGYEPEAEERIRAWCHDRFAISCPSVGRRRRSRSSTRRKRSSTR